jgi:ApbE superfamily uncharacterized protein (UPF0280 family)
VLSAGALEAVVDNGGDIALKILDPVRVGIYTGKVGPDHFAFEFEPQLDSFAICTSSGTVGPSISFGRADAVVVIAADAPLADAAATALGNRIKTERDLAGAFDIFDCMDSLSGALAVVGHRFALWGDLPKISKAHIDEELITRGKSHGKS